MAHWEILTERNGVPLQKGVTKVKTLGWRAGAFHGPAELLAPGLAELARELALALERMQEMEPRERLGPGSDSEERHRGNSFLADFADLRRKR